MDTLTLRKKFIDFFRARDHKIVPSSSLVPDDPTLLLTAAGMVQFKPIFLGKTKVDYTRAASIQKCARTTDIERVGHTARHLTFFEMFGNFSFGDYYKKEACAWAWEFLTGELKLPAEKLWVTIFTSDEEAGRIWRDDVGVDESRIVRLGEEDNFWSAGPTGPCGPCSEIIYDYGPERGCGEPDCGVGCDCDRYLEIWNLVFMQYNRDEQGKLHPLPKKNIDTGMGLERIASVLQGTPTNFEIDIIKPLVDEVAATAAVSYGRDPRIDISLKIIADHLRAVTFMAADGIAPANEGRGYILRRLIRRAVRHGRLLGIDEPFTSRIVAKVVGVMGDVYPELRSGKESIIAVAAAEEERFNHTLKQGLTILNQVINEIKEGGAAEIGGDVAFKLYDTYGFPLELTIEIAGEADLKVDIEAFNKLMAEQKRRARAEAVTADGHARVYVANIYPKIKEKYGTGEFTGYETEKAEAEVVALARGEEELSTAGPGDEVEIFLDHTPFYAEKGGQIGDIGIIESAEGRAEVIDTYEPLAGLIAHKAKVVSGTIKPGRKVTAAVDERRRRAIARNHTATHLLHWALRIILGEHVKQAGSWVGADRLRFDFTHHGRIGKKEIDSVQRLVNEKILQNNPVRAYITTLEYAKEIGAMALFTEKYGRFVRVVEIGDYSKELCGGVHLSRTSEIGFVKIINISSIGADTKRIEALTGEGFLAAHQREDSYLRQLSELLKVGPGQVVKTVENLRKTLAEQQKELDSLRARRLDGEVEAIMAAKRPIGKVNLITHRFRDVSPDELRRLADRIRALDDKSLVLLAAVNKGNKVNLLAAAADKAVAAGYSAVAMVKVLAPIIGGGGGGRDDLAQAGGGKAAALDELFKRAAELVAENNSSKA